jgi:ketosteroid isomerase-like protein
MRGTRLSAENVQVLRDAYAAFVRQDIDAVMAALDEDIEWTTPMILPSGGTYRGHEGVGALFGGLAEAWLELNVEPEEFIDAGDTIVVVVRERATGAGGGQTDTKAVHIWRMRDGKATSFVEYMDTARMHQTLG